MADLIQIGFWRNSLNEASLLPFPIVATRPHNINFVNKCSEWAKFSRIENKQFIKSDNFNYRCCKGCSRCRLCNSWNGNMEFDFNGYTFPEGLMHYILVHNIEIDKEFVEMITNNPLPEFDETITDSPPS